MRRAAITNECENCPEKKRCDNNRVAWLFVSVGLIGTIAIRITAVLAHVSPVYAKMSWYLGVIGLLVFFIYKYRISASRSFMIRRFDLLNKLGRPGDLTGDDYSMIKSILCGVNSKKDRMNFLFIFVLSAVALTIAAYFDFVR